MEAGFAERARMDAETVLSTFENEVIPLQSRPNTHSSSELSSDDAVFSGHDSEQIKLMAENCIVLDYNDNAVGAATKKACHLMENINRGLLHRAFSVFAFDAQGRLLLQQRAAEKITFPNLWTNTCCSHPLCVDDELGSSDSLKDKVAGARIAAARKLEQELGITVAESMTKGKFYFLNRIHYAAPSNEPWGEHEIDYIFFYKVNADTELTVNPNPNEVQAIDWVTQNDLRAMFKNSKFEFTPWFRIICNSYLFPWWDQLTDLSKVENDSEIHRML